MSNPTQFERYQRLLAYIDSHVAEDITTEQIESVCFYSYRNINRIFSSLNGETIGHYIKRLRIEKAAEFLKYSSTSVSDIALSVGFSDTASFSKAFKKMVGCAPSSFRETNAIMRNMRHAQSEKNGILEKIETLEFELIERSDTHVVYSQYRGSYENIDAMQTLWSEHIAYGIMKGLLNNKTVYLAEVLDDDEITTSLNCRYNAVFSIDESSSIKDDGAFRRKVLPGGSYAKFEHLGSHASSDETYHRIYSQWMHTVDLELDDKATLEIYVNDDGNTTEADLITEIFIPVIA